MRPVLVVDDEPSVRRALGRVLAQRGLFAVEAGSGEEALSVLDRTRVEAVVLDLDMPGMGGEAALAVIMTRAPTLPVIVFSAALRSDAELCERLLAAGARALCDKPDAAGLLRQLEAILQ